METLTMDTVIPEDRKLCVELPRTRPAEVTVVVDSARSARGRTAGDLLPSPLVGIWKDRTDLTDNIEFARNLRRQAERRVRG